MKILFISHEGTRTGAPYVLLHFLNWLKQSNTQILFDTLVLKDGDLVPEFKKVSENVYIKKNCYPEFTQRILSRINGVDYKKVNELKEVEVLAKGDYDLIYANSVASLSMALELKRKLNIPLILHLHELKLNISFFAKSFLKDVTEIDSIICASEAVRQNILNNYGVSKSKTHVIYEFVDVHYVFNKAKQTKLVKDASVFRVCASGTLNWRKNPDSFIQTARLVKEMNPDKKIEFVWVGAYEDMYSEIYLEDINKLKASEYIKILGKLENPFEVYNTSDVFLMTSKEDPFPLVCIESGLLGKPIICFENSGGIPEMIAQGGGKVIPYLDNNAMAEAINLYLNNSEAYLKDSTKIEERCKDYVVEEQGPKILEVIKSFEV